MSFRRVPKSVTLNDLEWRNGPYFAEPDRDAVWGTDSWVQGTTYQMGVKIRQIHLQLRGVTSQRYGLLPNYSGHLFLFIFDFT